MCVSKVKSYKWRLTDGFTKNDVQDKEAEEAVEEKKEENKSIME